MFRAEGCETRRLSDGCIDNLLKMDDTSEDSVLQLLEGRFKKKHVYTKLGNVLIFVNPNEHLPIYDASVINQYNRDVVEEAHIFSIAEQAFFAIREGVTKEQIVFSGESGSGKTTNAMHTLRYLASISPSTRQIIGTAEIEALYNVLGSFASARTTKNERSTRVGYSIELLYRSCSLEGLAVRSVLPLEVQRITRRRSGERNFNIFYEICAGLPSDLANSYGIKSPGQKFFYLANENQAEEVSDKQNFAKLSSALSKLGFTDDQKMFIFSLLIGILHVGNLYYSTRKDPKTKIESVHVSNESELKWIAYLLGVSYDRLAQLLVQKHTKTEDGVRTHHYTLEQALDVRDSLAQMLYDELFKWITARISHVYKCSDHTATISVLDFYGFEKYNNNSLEQLLVNSANEKIEQYVMSVIFENEFDKYTKEDIKCDFQLPKNVVNEKVVDLLTKRPYGILPILDDECKFPKATDQTYLQHCNINHIDKPEYGKARNKDKLEFGIHHFFSLTWYTIDGYPGRNRRIVHRDLIELLAGSGNATVGGIFRSIFVSRSKDEHIVLVAENLVRHAIQLVEKLKEGHCEFVRCFRSNNEHLIDKFDLPTVSRHLKSYAIYDTLRFRVAGFPISIPFDAFVEKYRCLLPSVITSCQKKGEILHDILVGQGIKHEKDHQIGNTVVFLRENLYEQLNRQRKSILNKSSIIIQKTVKAAIVRRKFLKKKRAVIVLQSGLRRWKARREYLQKQDETRRKLEEETKHSEALKTYRDVNHDDIFRMNDEVCKSVLGTMKHLDVAEDLIGNVSKPTNAERLTVQKIQQYAPIKAEMLKPKIEVQTIEEFAAKNFKNHLLEVRRDPIQTPFLAKENAEQFHTAIDIFKHILKYSSDPTLSPAQRYILAKSIIQKAIDMPIQRDELFVQLCNQTYNNRNKELSERTWTLLLMATYAFPPSILVLPMLLSYFASQPEPRSTYLMEGLVRKIRSYDAQACRLFAANQLEYEALSTGVLPVVKVHLPDQQDLFVECHPWCTADEMAQRVLRERAFGDQDGWTICVESSQDVFCPTGGHFIHDAIAAIEKDQHASERNAFYNFKNERTLPPTNKNGTLGRGDSSATSGMPQSILRNASQRSGERTPTQTYRRDTDSARYGQMPRRQPSSDDGVSSVPSTTESSSLTESSDDKYDRARAIPFPLQQQPIQTFRETYIDPNEKESDYCYTIPNKQASSRENTARKRSTNSRSSSFYDATQPMPPQLHPAGASTLQRYHDYQSAYAALAPGHVQQPGLPQQQMYIQYVPVVVSQPILQGGPIMAGAPLPGYPLPPQGFPTAVGQQYQQVFPPGAPPLITSQGEQRNSIYGIAPSPLIPPQTPNSFVMNQEDEKMIRDALERRGVEGVEAPAVLSVASRIRRMPVPSANSDVDRFLDEVFQQVLTPEETNMSTQAIAASIKGGKGKKNKQQQPEPMPRTYYEPPNHDNYYNTIEYAPYPGGPAPRRYEQNAPCSPYVQSLQREAPRGTDPLPRRARSPLGIKRTERIDGRRRHASCDAMTHEIQRMHADPRTCQSDNYLDGSDEYSSSSAGQQYTPSVSTMNGHRMYDEYDGDSMYTSGTGGGAYVGRYGTPRANSKLSVAEEVDIPMSRASNYSAVNEIHPVPARRLQRIPKEMVRQQGVVQGDVMNSEHPVTHKLFNPGKDFAKEQYAKEREALQKITERAKHLPPPVDAAIIKRPKPKPQPPPVAPAVHIPDEPAVIAPHHEIMPPPPPKPIPAAAAAPLPPVPQNTQRGPRNGEWIFESEVERPADKQNMIIARDNQEQSYGEIEAGGYSPTKYQEDDVKLPYTVNMLPSKPLVLPQSTERHVKLPVKERTAVYAPNQPWKLTIRKEVFFPNEQLDDVQLIDQVFAQIIEDCRKAIAYRIRASEREDVQNILRKHAVPPQLLNHQQDIPTEVKMEVIDAARKWPLYFNQIYEVIEERETENVFVLLAIGEAGIRILSHNPGNKESPLTVQDHFEFGNLKDVNLEERHLLLLRTRSNMTIRLRTEQAAQIRAVIEKFLFGSLKPKKYVISVADYVTNEKDHLSFTKGERIELIEKNHTPLGWLHGRISSRYGIFPTEHVRYEDLDQNGNNTIGTVPNFYMTEDVPEPYQHNNYEYASEGDSREKYTMLEFALLYYRQPKGNSRGRDREQTWNEVAKMIKWTDRPIRESLLRLDGHEMNKMACDAFLCIMKFMNDESLKKGETYTDCVYKLFLLCRKFGPLKDEVYCQIVRQTTSNKSENLDSVHRGWRLFAILTAFFDCSKIILPYLLHHLEDMARDERRPFHATAEQCLYNLKKTVQYGGRKFLLSGQEIEELTKGKTMKRQIYLLPGGHRKVINTTSVTVVEEIIKELCNELNIRSSSEQQEFSLCCLVGRENTLVYCANDEYILDICTELEHQKKSFVFILKRSVWMHPLRLDNALFIDTMYFQLVPDYLDGLLISPQHNGLYSATTLDDVARLSAYVYMASDTERSRPLTEKSVVHLLPKTALTSRTITPLSWVDRVGRKLRVMDKNMSLHHARAAFLELLEQWPSFGCAFFPVLCSFGVIGEEIEENVLAINKNGIRRLTPDNHRLIAEYNLSTIGPMRKYKNGEENYLDVTIHGKDKDKKMSIQTDKAGEIARLLGHYLFVFHQRRGDA